MRKPSLMTRIIIGKSVGFGLGLLGFFLLPPVLGETDLMIRWGFVFWYTLLGAVVAVFGVFTWHPMLKLPMPWWFRSFWIGAWMNFILTLLIHDRLEGYMVVMFGERGVLASPFWFVAEGALVALLIGFLATRFGGEGKETVGH